MKITYRFLPVYILSIVLSGCGAMPPLGDMAGILGGNSGYNGGSGVEYDSQQQPVDYLGGSIPMYSAPPSSQYIPVVSPQSNQVVYVHEQYGRNVPSHWKRPPRDYYNKHYHSEYIRKIRHDPHNVGYSSPRQNSAYNNGRQQSTQHTVPHNNGQGVQPPRVNQQHSPTQQPPRANQPPVQQHPPRNAQPCKQQGGCKQPNH